MHRSTCRVMLVLCAVSVVTLFIGAGPSGQSSTAKIAALESAVQSLKVQVAQLAMKVDGLAESRCTCAAPPSSGESATGAQSQRWMTVTRIDQQDLSLAEIAEVEKKRDQADGAETQALKSEEEEKEFDRQAAAVHTAYPPRGVPSSGPGYDKWKYEQKKKREALVDSAVKARGNARRLRGQAKRLRREADEIEVRREYEIRGEGPDGAVIVMTTVASRREASRISLGDCITWDGTRGPRGDQDESTWHARSIKAIDCDEVAG